MLPLLLVAGSLQLLILGMLRLAWSKRSTLQHSVVPVSVLIAAHNEARNLATFLPSVLGQEFSGDYEVIVILDRCSDGSAAVVAGFQQSHPRLRALVIETLPEGWAGKKHALQCAIQAASYDCLALTDADCQLPPRWLQGMADRFAAGDELVLGVSPYFPARGMLNLFIRFETWMTAILYIGLAHWGMPYMGVGRSIGYRKSWFERMGGFAGIQDRMSGDDDLLVNRGAKRRQAGLLTGLDTQVLSVPKTTWRSWLRQKMRHGSAGTAYKPASLLILSFIHGLHLFFYLSLVVVLCLQADIGWAVGIYVARTVATMAILGSLPWRHKAAMVFAFPLLDVYYLFYLTLLMPAAAFIRPKWN